MSGESFTLKEFVIKLDEKLDRIDGKVDSFRDKYDADQDRRDEQIAKRPTRGELYAALGAVSTVVGITVLLVGG